LGKDALTVASQVLTRVAAYAFDPAALVEAEHVVAYSVEISMVAIMVARPQCAYQRALCGLRGLLARRAARQIQPLSALARSSRAYLSARQSHRTILTDTLKSFTPISRPHAASERLVLISTYRIISEARWQNRGESRAENNPVSHERGTDR
jgi:hypothetical protein